MEVTVVSFLTSEGLSSFGDILIPELHEFPSLYEALIVYLCIYFLGREMGLYLLFAYVIFVSYGMRISHYQEITAITK